MGEPVSYLDYNATTPLRPAAWDAMAKAAAVTGNPSSVHGPGRDARRVLEAARATIARAVNAKVQEVVFTSGGTEANNLAIQGLGACVLYAATEHDSARAPAIARDGIALRVGGDGRLDMDALEAALKAAPRPALVVAMLANNETGVLTPVRDIAALVHAHGGLLHCDAVQALGKTPVDFAALDTDSLAISAHKIGGPKGVGALILRDGLGIRPLIQGGGQERRRRAGTENLIGIAGFAGAVAAMEDDDWARVRQLRDRLEATVQDRLPTAIVVAKEAPRLPNTTCLALAGVASETQVMALDLAGVAVSAGAACSSGKVASSHVLEAMGYAPKIASAAIRISLGWDTTGQDVSRFAEAWIAFAKRTEAAA